MASLLEQVAELQRLAAEAVTESDREQLAERATELLDEQREGER